MPTRYDDLDDTHLIYAMHLATREVLQTVSEDDGSQLADVLHEMSLPEQTQPAWPDTAPVYRRALEQLVAKDRSGRVEAAVDKARHKAMATTGFIEAFTIITVVGLIIGMTKKIKVGGDTVLSVEFREDLPPSMKEFLTTFVQTAFGRGGRSKSLIQDNVPVEDLADSGDGGSGGDTGQGSSGNDPGSDDPNT
jgi:hypothetical protein